MSCGSHRHYINSAPSTFLLISPTSLLLISIIIIIIIIIKRIPKETRHRIYRCRQSQSYLMFPTTTQPRPPTVPMPISKLKSRLGTSFRGASRRPLRLGR
ncbi:hypothetical protein BJX65DRAFT_128603 [Aspergillus insuetus]